MIVELRLPQASMNMAEATIVEWHKQPGERFVGGEPIYAYETEKVTQDVEAPGPGTLLEQKVPLESDAAVGDVIGIVDLDP